MDAAAAQRNVIEVGDSSADEAAPPPPGHVVDMDETLREDENPKDQFADAPSSSEDKNSTSTNPPQIRVGGTIKDSAFCLLAGVVESKAEDDRPSLKQVTFPIRHLPATLGRNHDTDDPGFVGLGPTKSVSRDHVRITYRTPWHGTLESSTNKKDKGQLRYQQPNIKLDVRTDDSLLPETGFFTITCEGKNGCHVDGEKVERGETVHLRSGSALRISSYLLYFLLPEPTGPETTIEVPLPSKKRKGASSLSTAGMHKQPRVLQTSKVTSAPIGNKAEIDAMTDEELMEELQSSMEHDESSWDRRQQYIGSSIMSQRAVLAAARDPDMLEKARKHNGALSRAEVMEWIENDDVMFKQWKQLICSKIELKSYQTCITKALQKTGFERDGKTTGRYIRWTLPKDILEDEDMDAGSDEDEEDSSDDEVQEVSKPHDGDTRQEDEEESGSDASSEDLLAE